MASEVHMSEALIYERRNNCFGLKKLPVSCVIDTMTFLPQERKVGHYSRPEIPQIASFKPAAEVAIRGVTIVKPAVEVASEVPEIYAGVLLIKQVIDEMSCKLSHP